MSRLLPPLLVAIFLSGLTWAEEPVYFADPNLKAAVEEELWVSDPTPTDMLGLTSLRAGSLEIAELTGLQYATNLQTLWLRLNWLTDISVLSALTNLEHLVLHRNLVSDLSPLSGLTKLYHLNLDNNRVSDISPLSSLTNLRELILYDNRITGLSALVGLTSLELLEVRANPLSDAAYDVDIPQIIANNPGIDVKHDRLGFRLTLSSGTGGSVVQPGEGLFIILDEGKTVFLEAEADPCFVFVGFSGTWSTQANRVFLVLEQHQQVRANFESVLSVLHVDDDAPNDPLAADASAGDPCENGTPEHPFDRIQEAIEVAANGAVVLVHPGTYRENIDFLGKHIQLLGADPNDSNATGWPVIEAATSGPVVRFSSGEDPNGALVGFVITGGKDATAGVIHCSHATATLSHCLIAGNRPKGLNAAVVHCEHSNVAFVNCTIADNHIGTGTAGFRIVDSEVAVTSSIFWNNTYSWSGSTLNGILVDDSAVAIGYSNIVGGWPGLGNIEADPLFAYMGCWVDPDNAQIVSGPDDPDAIWMMGDYHPKSHAGRWAPDLRDWVQDEVTSPCIDAGLPASPVGSEPAPNGERINMGAYGGTTQASKTYSSP